MLDPNKINVTKPVAHPIESGDFLTDIMAELEAEGHEVIDHTTPADRRAAIIREEYARTYPWLTQYPETGRCYGLRFRAYNYRMPEHAEYVWHTLECYGMSMFQLFPFFHYFLDFADPFRKIALLVEEDDTPWREAAMKEQDRLLALSGWTVYRIPKKVATTLETDILPDELYQCPNGEFVDNEQRQEYLSYKPRLNMETLDGFISWLKKEVYCNS